jgi:uncharacterized membrane protein YkvA (DUF1232 family)
MRMLERVRAWAERLKQEVLALWFAYRHPDTPWYAKLWAALVVAYAFSPIDLIPDFIPVIGLLDDALLVPVGLWLALKLIPAHALGAGREQARLWLAAKGENPRNSAVAVAIVMIWILTLALFAVWAWRAFAQ